MLRRLKKDVEQEIAPKTEIVEQCQMTYRQRTIYHKIRSKISHKDLSMLHDRNKIENLMNLVMHLRKVCNHPDLFEERAARIPIAFNELQVGVSRDYTGNNPTVISRLKSPLSFTVPKLIFDELMLVSDYFTTYRKLIPGEDVAFFHFAVETHFALMNIFNPSYLYQEIWKGSSLSILRLVCKSFQWSLNEMCQVLCNDSAVAQIMVEAANQSRHRRRVASLNQASQQEVNFYTNLSGGEFDI